MFTCWPKNVFKKRRNNRLVVAEKTARAKLQGHYANLTHRVSFTMNEWIHAPVEASALKLHIWVKTSEISIRLDG